MEDNLTDALMMAGAILIFVIALTVSMSSFSEMRAQIDEIMEMDSRVDLAQDNAGNYLNYITTSSDIRVVGIETVVSSMYRVAKENYVIYLKLTDPSDLPSDKLMKLVDTGKSGIEDQYFPDGEKISQNDKVLFIDINGKNSNVNALLETVTGSNKIYEILAGKKFKEYLGVYQEKTDANEANRTTYRVITYVEV